MVQTMLDVAGSSLEPDIQGTGIPTGEIDRQYLDSSLIEERLGWTPSWSLTDGLAATWQWYEQALPGVFASDLS
jgi:CDP-glucose 4,6-dehydratase